MECAYCLQTDAEVCAVGTCANHCTVVAHAACFTGRKSTSVWRNKHVHRDNRAPELCPHKTCQAKVLFKRKDKDGPAHASSLRPRPTKEERGTATTTPVAEEGVAEEACSFLGRDGGPCRRRAVGHGACALHARDARVLLQMLEKEDDKACCMADAVRLRRSATCDASTQTPKEETRKDAATEVVALRARVRTLERDLETMNLVYLGAAEAARVATLRDAARTLLACV